MPTVKKLGILAGGGALPHRLREHCLDQSIPYYFIAIQGHGDTKIADKVFRIGQAGKILKACKDAGVSDLVLIGSVQRPSLKDICPDWTSLIVFLKLWLGSWGDDTILKAVRNIIEKQGFGLRGVHEFLPDILINEGIQGQYQPTAEQIQDIQLGFQESQNWGQADKGQAVLVKDGQVIARETTKGTTHMIATQGQAGAILVKSCKPQQDRALDLPTIGPETALACAAKKMAGIAAHAGQSLVVDKDQTIQFCDQNGLFFYGISKRS